MVSPPGPHKERTERETVERYCEFTIGQSEGVPSYDLEVRMNEDGNVGYQFDADGFIVDAVITKHSLRTVAVEAKQFYTNGLRLTKGSYHQGIGQAIRYRDHFDEVEVWHFYVVPYAMQTPEQKSAITYVQRCHDRVQAWIDEHDLPFRLLSVAIRHQRNELQTMCRFGSSVVHGDTEYSDIRAYDSLDDVAGGGT